MVRQRARSDGGDRFCVTGASGPVGAWVVKLLLASGAVVTAFDDTDDDHRLRLVVAADSLLRVHKIRGAITDGELLEASMRGATHVVHLDRTSDADGEIDPGPAAARTVVGTANVFAAAAACSVRGLAFESSMAVFPPAPVPVTVATSVGPTSLQGGYQLAKELIAQWYRRSGEVASIGARTNLVYGPGVDVGPASTTTMAISAALEKRPFRLDHDGPADFQFVGDVAATLIAGARSAECSPGIVNIHGDVRSIDEFVRTLVLLTGADGLVAGDEPFPYPVAADEAGAIGSGPTTPLEVGIRETLEIFRWAPRELYQQP